MRIIKNVFSRHRDRDKIMARFCAQEVLRMIYGDSAVAYQFNHVIKVEDKWGLIGKLKKQRDLKISALNSVKHLIPEDKQDEFNHITADVLSEPLNEIYKSV